LSGPVPRRPAHIGGRAAQIDQFIVLGHPAHRHNKQLARRFPSCSSRSSATRILSRVVSVTARKNEIIHLPAALPDFDITHHLRSAP
jgi:hypothetical protein